MNLPQIPLKPGISTSEFWIVIFCSSLLTLQTAFSMLSPGWAMGGVTVLGLVYASIRGKLKGIQTQAAADQAKAQINNTPPPPAA